MTKRLRTTAAAPAARRALAALALVTGGVLLGAGEAAAQRVVHLFQEPRHRTVFVYNEDVRVLDVQINPGDTSLVHTHDSAILLNSIRRGSGPSNGSVSSNTRYAEEPYSHAVSNSGPGLMRIIAMPNSSQGVQDLSADRPDGLAGEPALENAWFRSYRIDLAPGEETTVHRHRNPVLVVQITEGKTHVTREDGITAELTEMGHWTWRSPESPYRIRNAGSVPIGVNVNEARGLR